MKVVGRDVNYVNNPNYKQEVYLKPKKTKRGYNWGKFRYRSKTRQAKKTVYKIKVKIHAVATKPQSYKSKEGIYTGISHTLRYYSASQVKKELQNAINQAKAYALEDMYPFFVVESETYLTYKILDVKVLRLKFKK